MAFDGSWSSAEALIWSWTEWKLFAEQSIGFTPDSLHVIAGVLILIATAVLLKKSVANWAPWFVVLVLAVLNEWADLWIERWPQLGMQYGQGAKDLLLTMFLPSVLLVTTRFWPWLYEQSWEPPRKTAASDGHVKIHATSDDLFRRQ